MMQSNFSEERIVYALHNEMTFIVFRVRRYV